MPSGLGFLPGGAGLFPRVMLDWLSLRWGTVAPARRPGFLCVISEALTFLSPFVTSDPLFNSLNTAPSPPPAAAGAFGASSNRMGGGGGPGGGGGGGAPPVAGAGAGGPEAESMAFTASSAFTPLGFHGMPCGNVVRTYSVNSLNT